MNKKQKILTMTALVAFGVIIFLHYYDPFEAIFYEKLFGTLAVFYAGLFFLLQNKRGP
jgi:hypothetical protein